MLTECFEPELLAARWAGRSVARRVLGQWLHQGGPPGYPPVRWFCDDAAASAVVLRLEGAACMAVGTAAGLEAGLSDLYHGRLDGGDPWPDEETREQWAGDGRRVLYLDRVPAATRRIALAAGFIDATTERQPNYSAHAWYLTGPPHFAELVRYPCREATGDELYPLFCADCFSERHKAYFRACLRAWPSYVCEIAGQPVSWSLTHLGGAMGAVYTPQEHRGRGYASSLAALQADSLLKRQGLAVASVSVNNPASYTLLLKLGAKHLRSPMTWSEMEWP